MADPRLEYVEFDLSTIVAHFAKGLQPKNGGSLILQDYFIDKGKIILKLIVINDNQPDLQSSHGESRLHSHPVSGLAISGPY